MEKELVSRFYNLVENMRNTMFRNHNMGEISKSEFSMLHLIKLCENELIQVTTSTLSEQLHISKPAVSQMISVLEKKQYIKREINKNDRRLTSISLTECGNEKIEEHKNIFLNKISNILDKMGKEDSVAFVELMEKYFEVIKEIAKK